MSPNNIVCKWEWPRLFDEAYKLAFTEKNIRAGFQKCGIVPINKKAIPEFAYAPSQPFNVKPETHSKSQTNTASSLPQVVSKITLSLKGTSKKMSPTANSPVTTPPKPPSSVSAAIGTPDLSSTPKFSTSELSEPTCEAEIPTLSNDLEVVDLQEQNDISLMNISVSDLLSPTVLLSYLADGGDLTLTKRAPDRDLGLEVKVEGETLSRSQEQNIPVDGIDFKLASPTAVVDSVFTLEEAVRSKPKPGGKKN